MRGAMERTGAILVAVLVMSMATAASGKGLETKTVSIFKNGSGFFVKHGTVTSKDGMYTMEEVPNALFGTLWFASTTGSIKGVQSVKEELDKTLDATTMGEQLQGNLGAKVVLELGKSSLEGKLTKVAGGLVTIHTDDGWVTVPLGAIVMAKFKSAPSGTYLGKETKQVVKVDFQSSGKEDLDLMYMQKGIGWLPNYLIELVGDDEAKITLRASVINDVEDLVDADVNFVVGVPNFAYSYLTSPLVTTQLLQSFLQSLAYKPGFQPEYQSFANVMSQQMVNNNDALQYELPFSGGDSISVDGSVQGDMFFYSKKGLSLPKGGRAFFDIFSATVPYKHVYKVTLGQNNASYGYYANASKGGYLVGAGGAAKNKVYHSIKLENTTSLPWTTGSAMAFKYDGDQVTPLSQDMLAYTPIKGKGFLDITVSSDIAVKDKEKEIKRIENKKKRDGYYYDLVTVEGSIEIKNYKKKKVTLELSRVVLGHMKTTSSSWEVVKRLDIYDSLNRTSDCKWEIDVAAGASETITYTYEIYIRH